MKRLFQIAACLLATLPTFAVTAADEAEETTAVQKVAVQKVIAAYVAAFNTRDVEKLVHHWSPDGVYTSRTTGEVVLGREAVAEEFAVMFADESLPKLAVATESIEFISPNVALERGIATVTHAENEVAESRYRVVYVKREGSWLIDRVTEDEVAVDSSHYENLKELEWLVGDWFDEGEGFTIEIACKWTKNRNFLSRTYVVSNEEEVESSGLQIISWDPKEKKIRSWLFGSDGGVVTGEWTKRNDHWVVQSIATLADGGSGSFASIFRPLEDDAYAWQKINRVVEGRLLPNIDEIVMQRK